ncbi:hypothetical protein ACLOJK_037622 [Asimina triloba]
MADGTMGDGSWLDDHWRGRDSGRLAGWEDKRRSETTFNSQVITLYHAAQSLQPAFHHLISSLVSDAGSPLLCIVTDMFLARTVEISRAFGLLYVALYTSDPYAMAIFNSIWTHLPRWRPPRTTRLLSLSARWMIT